MGRNKKLRKKIQGELDVINKHLAKISAEKEKAYPDKRAIAAWEKDIARHMRILAALSEKLPGGES